MVIKDHLWKLELFCLVVLLSSSASKASWWDRDAFDDIQERMDAVTGDTCESKSFLELHLPRQVLSQLPVFNRLEDMVITKNRSNLLYLHNMALNRAMYYSFIMQTLGTYDKFQPGLMYYYLSASADIGLNDNCGSGVVYDTHCSFPNWYRNMPFNDTLPLFAPRARKNTLFERKTTLEDYGAGPNHNYTTPRPSAAIDWYDLFLPDGKTMASLDALQKHLYRIDIEYGDGEGNYDQSRQEAFHGPPLGRGYFDFPPVQFTVPYFDCGHSNTWVVDAVAPVVDHLPRYTPWQYHRRFRYAAVSTESILFQSIDHNQCPLAVGNEPPNYLAGTAKCKDTTVCYPLPGFGFNRGGYQCRCLPGLVYPPGQGGPFQGVDIEQASQEEYETGFDCITASDPVLTTSGANKRSERAPKTKQSHATFVPRYNHDFQKKLLKRRDLEAGEEIMENKELVNAGNCGRLPPEKLKLSSDVTYGVEEVFANQARTSLRLAQFLSGYLQNLGRDHEDYSLRPDPLLNEQQYFGEALANVMGDTRILASGIFFDENQFNGPEGGRRYFAPWVHRLEEQESQLKGYDMSGEGPGYLEEDWFAEVKARWSLSVDALERFEALTYRRSDHEGSNLVEHDTYTYYSVSSISDGFWSQAVFPCNGKVDTWQITYSLPFFGPTDGTQEVQFKGVVTVTVRLDDLDINQCPMPPTEANPFANTAVCPDEKPTCFHNEGMGFVLGEYACFK